MSCSDSSEGQSKAKWQRIMYADQNYSATFISTDFLQGLENNPDNIYCLRDVCPKAMLVALHVSTMILMAGIYFGIKDDHIQLVHVKCVSIVLIGIICLLMMVTGAPTNDYLRNVRFTVAVYITLELLQPVLQTLTSSFSDDTVYALAIMASLLHVMTLDFDVISRHDDYIRDVDAMPINCLLLASVLIASRFGNPKKASTFLQCHVIAFSLLALAQIWLVDTKNRSLTYGFTLLVVLATSLYIFTLQFSWLVVYSLGIVLLTFVMPLFYVYAQRYKRNVSGPWNPDQIPTRPKSKSTSAGSRSAATTPLSSEGNSPRCKATELVTDTPENLWTHNVTINVPSAQVCKILTLVLKSEPCINPKECTISFSAQENILKVEIVASNQRALRLQTNGFYESCYTIMSTLETFHPDMQQT